MSTHRNGKSVRDFIGFQNGPAENDFGVCTDIRAFVFFIYQNEKIISVRRNENKNK